MNTARRKSSVSSSTEKILEEAPAGERWFAVHTLARREAFAKLNLERQNFKTFMPTVATTVRRARKSVASLTPLFPRYLFVAMDLGRDRWRCINGTFGVASLVMEGGRPKPVPPTAMQLLKSAVDAAGLLEPREPLAVGDQVRILNGSFADRLARVHELRGSERVAILLEMMDNAPVITLERKRVLRTTA